MISDFPRTLSLLRQEKKISQRKAAAELGVSQALLSHYENGAREPGLTFVVRAADYYGVSADFLLGRTMARDGGAILAEDLTDSSLEKGNVLKGSAAAMISKKLLVNAISLLYEQLGRQSRPLVRAVSDYLCISFYKVYRLLYAMDENGSKKAFAAHQSVFSELCDAEQKKCEALLRRMAAENEDITLDMSLEHAAGNHPMLAPSLLSLLHNADEKIAQSPEKNEKNT